MKYKTTKRAVMNGHARCFGTGYYKLDFLTKYLYDPQAYTMGTYGWNADIYEIWGTDYCIVTGYRPFGERIPSDLIEKYEDRMKRYEETVKDWTERRKQAVEWWEAFCEELVDTLNRGRA